MKIELTNDQLKAILSEYFKTPIESVTISVQPDMADIIEVEIRKYDYSGLEKITAIKALRQMTVNNKQMGGIMQLAYARYAIEHFNEFIQFVRKYDRFPSTDWYGLV